jgi:hypothetical protein
MNRMLLDTRLRHVVNIRLAFDRLLALGADQLAERH